MTVNAGTICGRSASFSRPGKAVGTGATPAEGRGWGGAAVVLRVRESRAHGKGRQRVSQGGIAMSEDAPVNTGAVEWPHHGTEYAGQVALLGGGRSPPQVW